MFDVTTFILRWLYMSRLIHNIGEIQSHNVLPYYSPPPPPPPPPGATTNVGHIQQHQQQQSNQQEQQQNDMWWKQQCLHGILSYPSGSQRLYAIDAVRAELIQQLERHLQSSDFILKQCAEAARQEQQKQQEQQQTSLRKQNHAGIYYEQDDEDDDGEEDPYLDADLEIVKAFERATQLSRQQDDDDEEEEEDTPTAKLVISDKGTDVISEKDDDSNKETTEEETNNTKDSIPYPSEDELQQAFASRSKFRDYLPQLVSAVLKSPGPLLPSLSQYYNDPYQQQEQEQQPLLNPLQKLRHLLLKRCLKDANWGIELCWLLEAEVGRTWKTLFEHRQQTGKRLIIVLPAEKAAVLNKIGTEKREAFDLLQHVEQATAYGYYTLPPLTGNNNNNNDDDQTSFGTTGAAPLLPSSLSLRRCSHFGDTMHFVDRLTQISMNLRQTPAVKRQNALQDSLNEMNRRLRRRMVTRGDVSLDVEDYRGPNDAPHVSDVTVDMLKHSVHFPMEPQRVTWPGGGGSNDESSSSPSPPSSCRKGTALERSKTGVMRVLNIVTSECRLLASRERCPFLLHVEMAETGMEGNDARLYASSGSKHTIGTTIRESISISTTATERTPKVAKIGNDLQVSTTTIDQYDDSTQSSIPVYEIPSELLLHGPRRRSSTTKGGSASQQQKATTSDVQFPSRGGDVSSQENDNNHHNQESVNYYNGYQQHDQNQDMHHEMYSEGVTYHHPQGGPTSIPTSPLLHQQYHGQMVQQQQQQQPLVPSVTTKAALLERVFGLPWDIKCEQIRQASPYGRVKGWRLASFIMKAGEDIRRESLVMQVISKLYEWFQKEIPEPLRPKMRPYTIMCVGGKAGLLECLTDAKSLDEIKKKTDEYTSLRDFFERAYGRPGENSGANDDDGLVSFEQAQDNFLRSLVGYSLVCYILQIKDRHNANIMMDREGHIMHIDFGFVLGDTPKMGRVPIFSERAPFKLSTDFWQVLGGWNTLEGGLGVKFCKMFEQAFLCAAAHVDEIVTMVEAALINLVNNPEQARIAAQGIRKRLRLAGAAGSRELQQFIVELVNTARTSWGTSTYDWLQKNMNGYQ